MQQKKTKKMNALKNHRYARQLALPEIGPAGQEKLLSAKVLIVGVGGLGSPAGLYLAAAGVGRLGIVDDDIVEAANLQRQILYGTTDTGKTKTACAAEKLRAVNPDVEIWEHPVRLTAANAPEILSLYDFVLDATDNFASKFLIADACDAAGKPYSHAGILRFWGQTMTVLPGKTACFRCLFDRPPAESDPDPPQGPLGVVPGVIGSIQAAEAIKFIVGCGTLLTDRLLTFDALEMRFREIPAARNPQCRLCGTALERERRADIPVRHSPDIPSERRADILVRHSPAAPSGAERRAR